MLKYSKKCRVCTAIKDNKKLIAEIYDTSYYIKTSTVSLQKLQATYKDLFSYDSLRTHVKKHQFISEKQYMDRHLKHVAQTAERKMLKKSVDSIEVWDEVIATGMHDLQEGKLTMRTSDLLKAAKDKSDFHLKKQDQDIKMAEMVYHFASGENQEGLSKVYDRRIVEGEAVTDFNPAEELAGRTDAGQDRPSGIHYPPSWDAAT